ncbi:MAG: hypothetical protein GEU79_09890 [Acidimicrobiia bacterium]|nr:hypothetical protein [Acidimicrobiia bacterium]
MWRRVGIGLLLYLLVGCSGGEMVGQAMPRNPAQPVSPTTTDAAAPTTTMHGEGCGGADPLVEEGLAGAFTEPSDAGLLSSITWEDRGECEAFILRFETTNGAPATTPPGFAALLRRGVGVLRIELDLTETLIAQQLVESRFVSAIYVPVHDNGTRFADLVLSNDALARVTTSRSPGTIEVQLHPGGEPIASTPMMTDNIVLVSFSARDGTPGTVVLAGYTTGSALRVVAPGTDSTLVLREEVEGAQPWTGFETEIQMEPDEGVIEVVPQRDGVAVGGIAIEVEPPVASD